MHFTKECNLNYGPISAKKLKHDAIHTFTDKANKTIYETIRCKGWVRLGLNIEKLEPSLSILSSTCRKSFSSNGCSMSEE
jgi:hypothetical protein